MGLFTAEYKTINKQLFRLSISIVIIEIIILRYRYVIKKIYHYHMCLASSKWFFISTTDSGNIFFESMIKRFE